MFEIRQRSGYAGEISKRSFLFMVSPTVHTLPSRKSSSSKTLFTITAEIHARSLAKFYGQYADRHMNLKFVRRVSEQEREIRQSVIVKNKLMPVFNASVLLLTMNFVITLSKWSADPQLHNIVKVVCGSTHTLTMLWPNSWSITGQTHKKLTSICQLQTGWNWKRWLWDLVQTKSNS